MAALKKITSRESVISSILREKPESLELLHCGAIACSDALAFLRSIEDEVADIIFLDPPFNLGKKYGSRDETDDRLGEEPYASFLTDVLDESIRILKPGAALYLYHLPSWAMRLGALLQEKLLFRHWIAISMKGTFPRPTYLYPAHYALLYFTKGRPTVFSRPKIEPPTCRHCGGFIRDYGGYKKLVEDGINLSDFWEDLSPVRHKKYKNRSANELPLELLRRVVQVSGIARGLIVDPFVGSGTSLIAALEADMFFLAADRERKYCDDALCRVKDHEGVEDCLKEALEGLG